MQEAIEGDGIFASVFQVGTPNVAGTRQLHADACVPQALVGTGFPNWGDPANFPWTTGGIPSYTVESAIWTDFIKEKFPDATKVAILSFNNDFGKTYQAALQRAAPGGRARDRRPTSCTSRPRTCPTRSPSCWPPART